MDIITCPWLNEISFPDFVNLERAPRHLRARGHGPAGPCVNPALLIRLLNIVLANILLIYSIFTILFSHNNRLEALQNLEPSRRGPLSEQISEGFMKEVIFPLLWNMTPRGTR